MQGLVRFVSIPKRVSEALKHPHVVINASRTAVSIPKRVSEALKLTLQTSNLATGNVSIPKRVSEALKHLRKGEESARSASFNP